MAVHPRILRTIDANVNRISEGLRVLEDISRYIIEDAKLSRGLKSIRHQVNAMADGIGGRLIRSRDADGDVGAAYDVGGSHGDLTSVVRANAKRAQQGLRVLEELSKLPDLESVMPSSKLKGSRYAVYSIEKEILMRLPEGQQESGKDDKASERKRKGHSQTG